MTTGKTANLKVAVIGLGRMGMRHLETVKKLGMQVVGVMDVSDTALAAARTEFGVPAEACFTDVASMLRMTKPEGLVVATTAPTHAEYVIAGANAGVRYILCEKPLAVSLAEADAMLEACRRSGTALAVNHQMRFMPHYNYPKALIGSDEFGPLASILVAGSNFGLAMNGSHYFEMFRYMTDGPVEQVQAWLEDTRLANPRGAQFEDRPGRLLARNKSGVSMFMDFSESAGYGFQVVYICRNGQIVMDELNGEAQVAARKAEFRDLPTTRYGMPADTRRDNIEPAELIVCTMKVWEALVSGGDYPDGTAGRHALACLEAAHVSNENGSIPIRLDDPRIVAERKFKWA